MKHTGFNLEKKEADRMLPFFISQSNTLFFKYILCYGSSQISPFIVRLKQNLNTSYVMVHRTSSIVFCRALAYLNISYVMVHHATMCRWLRAARFKYILCYGSSRSTHRQKKYVQNLNTSDVMVHREQRRFLPHSALI